MAKETYTYKVFIGAVIITTNKIESELNMSSSEKQAFLTLQNTKKYTNVSHHDKYPEINAGEIIAELEVGPHDESLMSLGTFEENEQPKGFCVAYNLDSKSAELAKIGVTTTTVSNGKLQYLLQIANCSNESICAEIRQL